MPTPSDIKKVETYWRKNAEDSGDSTKLAKLNESIKRAITDDQARFEILRGIMPVDNEGTTELPADTSLANMYNNWPRREEEIKIPTTKDIISSLDFKDVKDEDGNVTTAQEQFIAEYLKRPKNLTEKLEKKRPDFGSHSKELLKRAFQQSVYDVQEAQTQKDREAILNGDTEWKWGEQPWFKDSPLPTPIIPILNKRLPLLNPDKILPPKAQSFLLGLLQPSQKKAYMRGEAPSVGDYASDILGNALMAVPGTGYIKVGSKIPFVGQGVTKAAEWVATKAPKAGPRATAVLKSVGGNSVAPFVTEGLQYAGDLVDDDRTAEYNLGNAVLGSLTNIGVNDILVRGVGGVNKMLLDKQTAREIGKDVTNSLKGKASDKIGMDDAVQAYVVNKLGDQRAAEFAANKLGIGQETVKAWRKDSEDTDNARYINKEAEKQAILDAAQDEVDAKYLQMIVDNPDVLKLSNDTGFKMWLVTRGNDLLRGTSLHRPSWEVQ